MSLFSRSKENMYDLLVSASGLMLARVLALIISLYIARVAGAATFGEFSFFIAIFVLLSEVPNAIDTAFIRNANGRYSRYSTAEVLTMDFLAKLFYVVFFSAVAWFYSPILAEQIFKKPEHADLIEMAIISGALLGAFNTLIAYYQQQTKFSMVAMLRPASNALVFLFVVIVMQVADSVQFPDLGYVYFFSSAFLAALMFFRLNKCFYENIRNAFLGLSEFLRPAGILILSSLIGLVASRLDIFVLTSQSDFEEIGFYGAAVRVAILVSLFTAALTTVLVPRAAQAYASEEGRKRYTELLLLYSAFQTILALIVFTFVDGIIDVLFGEEYLGIGLVAKVLLLQVLFEAYGRGFQALIQCGPKPNMILRFSLMRLVLSIGLLSYFVPSLGPLGAAIAVTVTSGVIALGMVAVSVNVLFRPVAKS